MKPALSLWTIHTSRPRLRRSTVPLVARKLGEPSNGDGRNNEAQMCTWIVCMPHARADRPVRAHRHFPISTTAAAFVRCHRRWRHLRRSDASAFAPFQPKLHFRGESSPSRHFIHQEPAGASEAGITFPRGRYTSTTPPSHLPVSSPLRLAPSAPCSHPVRTPVRTPARQPHRLSRLSRLALLPWPLLPREDRQVVSDRAKHHRSPK